MSIEKEYPPEQWYDFDEQGIAFPVNQGKITSQKAESRFHEIEANQQTDPDRSRYLEELTQLRDEVDKTINILTEKSN